MARRLLTSSFALILLTAFVTVAPALAAAVPHFPAAFTKYSANPVLNVGGAASWEETEVFTPSVVFDGTTYHMW